MTATELAPTIAPPSAQPPFAATGLSTRGAPGRWKNAMRARRTAIPSPMPAAATVREPVAATALLTVARPATTETPGTTMPAAATACPRVAVTAFFVQARPASRGQTVGSSFATTEMPSVRTTARTHARPITAVTEFPIQRAPRLSIPVTTATPMIRTRARTHAVSPDAAMASSVRTPLVSPGRAEARRPVTTGTASTMTHAGTTVLSTYVETVLHAPSGKGLSRSVMTARGTATHCRVRVVRIVASLVVATGWWMWMRANNATRGAPPWLQRLS